MKSGEIVVRLQHHQALALVSSARWLHHQLLSGGALASSQPWPRSGRPALTGDPDQQRVALAQVQEAIDATTAQLERHVERNSQAMSGVPWRGYAVAVAAVLAATALIKACCVLGSPRTVSGLYVPVVVGIAMLIGRWPALLGCALALVLNDMLLVTPGQFAPGPEQIAVLAVVMLSCLALNWLVRPRALTRALSVVAPWQWSAETEGQWDELTMWLGSPEGAYAMQRARQIKAYGWELVAMIVRSGNWTFRRRHRND